MAAISESGEINVKTMLVNGLFFTVMGVLMVVAAFWIISSMHTDYSDAIAQRAPISVQNNGLAFFYGSFPLAAALLLIGPYAVWVGLWRTRSKKVYERVIKVGSYLCVIGLITLFAARFIGSQYWAEQYMQAGYSECSGAFSITKKWSRSVWTQDPALCTDSEVRRMFSSHEYRLPDINAYVKARSEPGNS